MASIGALGIGRSGYRRFFVAAKFVDHVGYGYGSIEVAPPPPQSSPGAGS